MQVDQTGLTISLVAQDVLIRPVQRVPRYKILTQELLKNTSEAIPLCASLTAILADLTALLDVLNEQPRMEELKQWKMSLSSEVAAVPNTVVWVYLGRYELALQPVLDELGTRYLLRSEQFKYGSAVEAGRILRKAIEFIKVFPPLRYQIYGM